MTDNNLEVHLPSPEVPPKIDAYIGVMLKIMHMFRTELSQSVLNRIAKDVFNLEFKLKQVIFIGYRCFFVLVLGCVDT